MMKFAVLGSPIDHSKSPALHTAAYAVLGLNWSYERFEVSQGELETFLSEQEEYAGFSLTMPLKEEAYKLAVANGWEIDAMSQLLEAGNTLRRVPGGFELYNTDVYGAYEALATKPNLRTSTAAILGAGATARSVALAVLNSFPDLERLTVFSRSAEGANRIFEVLKRGGAFPNDSGLELIWNSIEAAADFGGAGLTVNTLPSDVAANVEIDLPFNESWFFDVTYNPWPSVLSSSWPADHTISGIEMLVNQAIAQLRIFATGDAAKALDNEEDVHKAMAAAVL